MGMALCFSAGFRQRYVSVLEIARDSDSVMFQYWRLPVIQTALCFSAGFRQRYVSVLEIARDSDSVMFQCWIQTALCFSAGDCL